ncbi:hydrolase [Hyphodiscus hymeniophilus]|uniref:Hydrolase n=1 Tax=Hyphodiscus hymeniophilus TaxID=353542 RepID=A0A9P7AZT6_9HELO|nr:hydrolase [Hyphodiscus hymeniophilus]
MFFQSLVACCLALSGARLVEAAPQLNADQQCSFATIIPSKDLIWCPCFSADFGPNFSCALLDVPLDYANPTGRRAFVPFVKYAASTTPSKGVILFNPGGPGDSGVSSILGEGAEFAQYVVRDYDLVSFDPRGIGFSIPLANCSASVVSSTAPLTRRFVDKLHGPHFDAQYFSDFYQSSQTLGRQCQSTIGGPNAAGPHMNSAVVARDMISFLDAYSNSIYSKGVSDPNLLNFWGFSYGSYLGQVFANMFPNRVGRVVLDAVVDAAANLAGRELSGAYADEAFSTFFVYCNLAGPGNGPTQCPYYTGNTASDILARFEATITKLDPVVAKLKGWKNATVIELTCTYSLRSFPLRDDRFRRCIKRGGSCPNPP